MSTYLQHSIESNVLEKLSTENLDFDLDMNGDMSKKLAYRQLLLSSNKEVMIVATDIKSQCLDSLDMLKYFEAFLQKSNTKIELILQAQNKYDIILAHLSLQERLGDFKDQVYSTFVAPKLLGKGFQRKYQWLNDIPPFSIGDEKILLSLQGENDYRHLLSSQDYFNINFNNPEKAKNYKQRLIDTIVPNDLIATNSEYFLNIINQ